MPKILISYRREAETGRIFDRLVAHFGNVMRMAILAIILPVVTTSCSGAKTSDQGTPESNKTANPESGSTDKAILDCTEGILLDPKKVNDRGELAHYKRGKLYAEKGDHDKAIADFTEAIRLYPIVKGPYLRARQVEVYSLRADSYQKKGDHDKAIADYTEVIQLGTGGFQNLGDALIFGGVAANAHYKRGVCYDEKGEHDKALADYKEAVRIAPELSKNEDLKKRMSK